MMKYSKKVKVNVLIFVAIIIVIFVYWSSFANQSELPDGFTSSNGRTESTEVDITAKYGGRIERVLVKEGEQVTANQIVARIDTRELEAQLRRAEAEVRRTEQEKRFALAVIAQRQSELSLTSKDLQRSKDLYENDSISLERLQRDETAVETAKATVAAAQAQLSTAEAAIEVAIANTELIKTQVDDSVLKSPIGGRVLYRLAEPGEVLPSGGRVLTVLDPTDIYMTVFVPTHDASRVGFGAQARVILDGLPDIIIPAEVTFVAPQAQFTPKEVETRTEREKLMFRVKLQLDIDFLKSHLALAKTGIPGMATIRLAPEASWPENLAIVKNEP